MRDERGRFVKGESGNPNGRPQKQREERYYEILVTAVSFDEWKAIVKKAAEQAKRGDAVARKWLGDYLIGEPEQNIDHELRVIFEYVGDDDGETNTENGAS